MMGEKEASGFFYGYVIAMACFLIQGIGVGAFVAFGVFFKPLLAEFGWSRATISGASSMAFFLMGTLGMLAGNLNDRFGPRAIVAVTGVLYGTGYFLLSQLDSVWQLYLFLGLLVGVGLSSIDVIALSTTARWFARRRGTMTGLVKVGTGAGQLVIPMMAGLAIAGCGWRRACMLLGTLISVLIVGAGLLLHRDPSRKGQFPDGDEGHVAGQPDPSRMGLSLREALRSRQFWLVCTINLLAVYCMLTIMVHIAPHASDIGISPVKAAGILSGIGGVSMVGRLCTGIAIDRIGNKRSMMTCFVLLIASILWLQAAGGMWALVCFAVVYGLAHGGFFTLISPVVAELFGIGSHGVLFGIVAFSGTVGGAAGPLLAGHLFDLSGSYRSVFLILAGVAMAGLLLAIFLKPAVRDASRIRR